MRIGKSGRAAMIKLHQRPLYLKNMHIYERFSYRYLRENKFYMHKPKEKKKKT